MSHNGANKMNVYMYKAALYCEDCGKAIRQQLDRAEKTPDNVNDESSYDSDDYPKGPYPNGGGEADCPQHCDNGANCINAEIVARPKTEYKVGCFLDNDLTQDGVKYVVNAIFEGGEVANLWGIYYMENYDEISRAVAAVELLREYGFKPEINNSPCSSKPA
jgi:hypothetical protein